MKNRHLALTLFFYVAATACRAFVGIYLGRVLPVEDFAAFFLAFTVVQVGTFLCMFGQGSETVRFFSKTPLSAHQWRPIYLKIFIALTLISLAIGVFTRLTYDLSTRVVLLTVGILICKAGLEMISALFRAGQQFAPALTSQNLTPMLFAPLILVLFEVGSTPGVALLLGLFMLISLGLLLVHTPLLLHRFPDGETPIGREMLVDGFWLFVVEIAGVLFMFIDRLILGYMGSAEAFATYFAVFQLAYGYEIAAFALEFVLIPSVNSEQGRRSLIRALGIVTMGSILISLGYAVLGRWGLSFIYAGKYDAGFNLLVYFCAAGVVRFYWIVPHSVLMARADLATTRRFSAWGGAMTLIFALAFPVLFRWDGLRGAAVCLILAWIMRLAVEWGFAARIVRHHPDLAGPAWQEEAV